jgi:hypothetical protein
MRSKILWIVVAVTVAVTVLSVWSSAARAGVVQSNDPVFSASDSMSSDKLSGAYNLTQYADRAQLTFCGASLNKISSMSNNFWLQADGPRDFSFQLRFEVLDGATPVVPWEFRQYKSEPLVGGQYMSTAIFAHAYMNENRRWNEDGTSEVTSTTPMSAYYGNFYVPGTIDDLDFGSYSWDSASGKGILANDRGHYVLYVSGNGHFAEVSQSVPEPAGLGILAIGAAGLVIRRRRSR